MSKNITILKKNTKIKEFDELMKWVCEQKRCDIGITTQEITNKSIELDEN